MKNPFLRIITAVVVLILITGVVSYLTGGEFGIILLIPMGAVLGPFILFSFPFTFENNIIYVSALILSLICAVFGLVKRKKIWGQVLAILGIAGWFFCGIIGLGAIY